LSCFPLCAVLLALLPLGFLLNKRERGHCGFSVLSIPLVTAE
jgi:hypothetical protein